ncbi:MAG: helix-turn-helix domain-containing protein [Candidatus Thermoplasmatota archaeon]
MIVLDVHVPCGQCPLSARAREFGGIELRYVESVRMPERGHIEILEVRGERLDAFVASLSDGNRIPQFRVLEQTPEHVVCQALIQSACVRTAVAEEGGVPLAVRVRDGIESITLLAQDEEHARSLVMALRRRYGSAEIVRVGHDAGSLLTAREVQRTLTTRQEAILTAAFEAGYFDRSRALTGSEIAKDLKMDRSTFSRQLRSALRALLSPYAKREKKAQHCCDSPSSDVLP